MTNLGGNVDPVNGPFTWKLREEPQVSPNPTKDGYEWGPKVTLVQVDADGNEYEFADISPLVDPGDLRSVVRSLNWAEIYPRSVK